MTTEKLTQEQLDAMPDAKLNALAATLVMGWTGVYLRAYRRDHSSFIGGHYLTKEDCANECAFDLEPVLFWSSPDGWTFGQTEDTWKPTTDRNQSGGLLVKMAERGAWFEVYFDRTPIVWVWEHFKDSRFEVPGNSARSETIAAILAAQALEGNND